MTVLRMDNVLLVVDNLEAAKAFFAEFGLELEGETVVEGQSVDRLIGLGGVRHHRLGADPGRPRAD
jgi:catechol 2,3-dioxygenase-like lactoylglutathione lyase family enzyme